MSRQLRREGCCKKPGPLSNAGHALRVDQNVQILVLEGDGVAAIASLIPSLNSTVIRYDFAILLAHII